MVRDGVVVSTPWRSVGAICLFTIAVLFAFAAIRPSTLTMAAAASLAIAAVSVFFVAAAARNPAAPSEPRGGPASDAMPEIAREILQSIDEPVLVLDGSSRLVFVNAASQSLVRLDSVGKKLATVLRTPEVLNAVETVQQSGEAQIVTFTIPVPVQRHLEAHLSRTAGDLIVVRIRDVSDIRRADELRADFVANASHELRTPLASLTGFIDTLRGHARDDANARERFLEIMAGEASRMRRLIDDLLSLTKIELNEHNPPAAEVDVVATVRDAADALKPLADSESVTLEIEPHIALPVVGDRDELTQLFQNLLHNAIKYGRFGGRVRVRFGSAPAPSMRDGETQVFVAVEDEGEGIPREAIPRLTERFYRVDIRRSREKGGTGLGLAIVKHIINRHRGRLEIESVAGQGSTFTAWLPAPARNAN